MLGKNSLLNEKKKMISMIFSFARNPIAMKKDYRLYVIHMLPNLRTLDYNRITQKVFDLDHFFSIN